MTVSSQILALAAQGLPTSEIAKRLGKRYQHVYNVLKQSNCLPEKSARSVPRPTSSKPELTISFLLENGFQHSANWLHCDTHGIRLSDDLPKDEGVYAIGVDGIIKYVGLATMGLAKRNYFYARPGKSQTTSIRIKKLLIESIQSGAVVQVLIAQPPPLRWNELPVHASAGLEMGLIKTFSLPWNKRGA